jgi:threonyl-tRNA synthetase
MGSGAQRNVFSEAAVWEKSQTLLKEILDENKIEHQIGLGEAAIYGPKMDLIPVIHSVGNGRFLPFSWISLCHSVLV